MFNYYDLSAIPIILDKFNVLNIVICGNVNVEIFQCISSYCKEKDATLTIIDSKNLNNVNDRPLNILPNLSDFEAVFINDDANWYTVFNELNIIKKNNYEFPLVFIANNIFPNKRRDSYVNPELIPSDARNEFTDSLPFNNMLINTGLYHAKEENTPKNGVLTAIEDFLDENKNIDIMDIKFLNGLIILYPKNNVTYFKIKSILETLDTYNMSVDEVSDKLYENKILSSYINDFESKKELHDAEINYKISQIQEFDSKINLKNAQIKNAESKLMNTEQELNQLNSQVDSLKTQLSRKEKDYDLLKSNFLEKEKNFMNRESELTNQLNVANNKINDNIIKLNEKDTIIVNKSHQLNSKEFELEKQKSTFDTLKRQYTHQLSKLDNKEYCISCYRDEISNNHLEIQYLKKETIIKKLLTPFAYLYLVLKSNPSELLLNYKLYKTLKDSNCFSIGFYLNNNKDLFESKWCKYFSPELHYVCNGFDEERPFNKKYFNTNSKKELLDYIRNCQQ